jgi:hypothetical protein
MTTRGDSGDNKWLGYVLGYVLGCGLPASLLGSFAMTDQIPARPGLVAEVTVDTIAICGLNAWAWAKHSKHPRQFGTAACIGSVLMFAVFIHCLAQLACDGETTITHFLAGPGRQLIGTHINN